jgi:hypothetical protein
MCVLGLRQCFLALKMTVTVIAINHVDLVASLPWPRSTPQSEFPIKSYGRLKLRWSDFSFLFLVSLFFVSYLFLLSLLCLSHISLFIYENRWKRVGNLWDFYFLILIFRLLDWDEWMVRWTICGSKYYWWDEIY